MGEYGDANPEGVHPRPLCETAEEHGISQMLVSGLANDELGCIVPLPDFLVNTWTPYLARVQDSKGENHYEETNSVGPACTDAIARLQTPLQRRCVHWTDGQKTFFKKV